MLTIGQITGNKSATGHKMVNLWVNGEMKQYCLDSDTPFPLDHPSFGIFQFCPEDQFCRWVNEDAINKIEMNTQHLVTALEHVATAAEIIDGQDSPPDSEDVDYLHKAIEDSRRLITNIKG